MLDEETSVSLEGDVYSLGMVRSQLIQYYDLSQTRDCFLDNARTSIRTRIKPAAMSN